ncbi:gamma-glutamylcyclotransferase [Pontiellaceae bacterium B1224]|nr:gamma-glutamylcyclotransferase [Pontiellaceae bacterium B1224]
MNLFAYGTLMWPDVLEAVMGRRLNGEKATLSGYTRRRVKGQHYPAVFQASEESVEGILYTGLTGKEFQCLDAFEGVEYERVELAFGDTTAFVYVLSNDWKHIAESEHWLPEMLKPEHLSAFCSEYKGWSAL